MNNNNITNDPNMNRSAIPTKKLDLQFIYDVLGIPTFTGMEDEMIDFIVNWAEAHNIKCERDHYGNVYLTKGEIEEGEYYPCVSAHLDAVHRHQKLMAVMGIPLTLKQRVTEKGHEIYAEETGIGADDKAGVGIALSLFDHFDQLKACFFIEEEIGCIGSMNLDKDWFHNVGYVIGWDSPERNRAAYACCGELLFSKDFFENIKEVCERNGLTNFYCEPFTDVEIIKRQTGIMCMNIGNGGYNPHQVSEYVVLEEMDEALVLGIELIRHLGKQRYAMPSKNFWLTENLDTADEDIKYFSTFKDFFYSNR